MPAVAGSPTAKTRSRIGVAVRRGSPEDIADARREHAAAVLAEHIQRIVAEAPPLTREQRDQLALMLQNGGGANDAA